MGLEEILGFLIYQFYFILNSLVLLLPDVSLLRPHSSLTIQVLLPGHLFRLLLLGLHREHRFHFFFILVSFPCLLLLLLAQLHFSLLFILLDHVVFFLLDVVKLLQNAVSHSVHELLGSILPGLNLVESILRLLIEHPGVLLLGPDIFLLVFLLLDFGDLQVLFVLFKHLHKVLSFLLLLLELDDPLPFHLVLEPLDLLDLLLEVLSRVLSSLVLHLSQLCVSGNFILQDFVLEEALLFLLSVLKEFKMGLLSFIVLLVLHFEGHLLLDLDIGLLVQLLLHESLPLSLSCG